MEKGEVAQACTPSTLPLAKQKARDREPPKACGPASLALAVAKITPGGPFSNKVEGGAEKQGWPLATCTLWHTLTIPIGECTYILYQTEKGEGQKRRYPARNTRLLKPREPALGAEVVLLGLT